MSTCHWCGREVFLYKSDVETVSGCTGWERKGKWPPSHMSQLDPKNYFCTLRCAAQYGIREVQRKETK